MSDKVRFDVTIESHLPDASKALEKALEMWVEMTGGELVNLTHREQPRNGGRGTPVDTSRLRNSMAYASDRDYKTVYVGTNVEYAEFVEEGSSRADYGLGKGIGAHMLRNAVMDCDEQAKTYLQEALESQN